MRVLPDCGFLRGLTLNVSSAYAGLTDQLQRRGSYGSSSAPVGEGREGGENSVSGMGAFAGASNREVDARPPRAAGRVASSVSATQEKAASLIAVDGQFALGQPHARRCADKAPTTPRQPVRGLVASLHGLPHFYIHRINGAPRLKSNPLSHKALNCSLDRSWQLATLPMLLWPVERLRLIRETLEVPFALACGPLPAITGGSPLRAPGTARLILERGRQAHRQGQRLSAHHFSGTVISAPSTRAARLSDPNIGVDFVGGDICLLGAPWICAGCRIARTTVVRDPHETTGGQNRDDKRRKQSHLSEIGPKACGVKLHLCAWVRRTLGAA